MEDIKAVSKVVIMNGNRALFLKRSDKEWELPGGHLNRGENFIDGARREVLEETGIKLLKLKVVFKEKDFVLFKSKPKVIKIKLSHEHIDYIWVNKRDVFKLAISNATKKNIKRILKCF